MNILFTGATGWLGNRLMEGLCRRLVDQRPPFPGSRVRVLVGPGMDLPLVQRLGAEPMEGDLTQPETLSKAVEGVDLVFYVAG